MCVSVSHTLWVCVSHIVCVCVCVCASHTLECQEDGEHLSIKDELKWVSLGPALLKRASLVAQMAKNLLTMQAIWVQSLGWEDLPEKEMATHSTIPAWRIPWMEEPGGLQSLGSQRVGHGWATSLSLSCYSLNAFNSICLLLKLNPNLVYATFWLCSPLQPHATCFHVVSWLPTGCLLFSLSPEV